MTQERRKDVIWGLTVSEIIAIATIVGGGLYAVVEIKVRADDTKQAIIRLQDTHQNDVIRLEQSQRQGMQEIHDQLKEMRQDQKETQRDIKEILKALK